MRLLLSAAVLCLVLINVQGSIESIHDAQFQAALAEARHHLIIKIRQNGEEVASSFGPIIKRLTPLKMWVIRVDDDDIDAKMAEIRQHPDVISVEQDGIGSTGYAINDPLAPQQWALSKLRAYEVWDLVRISPASNISIAVADTGIEFTHEDLVDVSYLPGYDFVNGDTDPTDDAGHGTHVTGIIAATQNNAKGISGLAPGVNIMGLKVLSAANSGTWTDVMSSIMHAADAGMNIVSLSIQGYGPTDAMNEAVDYATERGTLVVACAGNLFFDGNIPSLPGAANNAFAVTNLQIDVNGVYSRYSASNTGSYVDIAAPGTDILSTYPTNSYASLTGCSMATPYVSALAALVWSVNPAFTNLEVRSIIESTAIDLGTPGRDDEYGNGAIDPLAAVRRALELSGTPVSVPPTSPPVATPVATPVTTPVAAPVSQPSRVIADTYVRDGTFGNTNYGTAPTLQVKNDTTPDWSRWTWVKINLSGLANLATLSLSLYGGRDDGSYSILGAFRASSSWDEITLTFNNQPAIGAQLTTVNVSTIGWYHFDLTSYANELISSGQSTLSIVIKSLYQSSAGFTSFESRESASMSLRPMVDAHSTTPVSTQTFVYPTDDATVRSGIYSAVNYGLEPTMYIKFSLDPNFTRQTYIKFPISDLAPIGTQRVVVRLFGYYQSTLAPLSVQCYTVPDVSWSQSTITWNNKPTFGVLLTSTDIGHPIAYYEFDVTPYVVGRQSSGASFVSFAFVRNTPGPDESLVLINSREADVNRPILAIVAGGATEAQAGKVKPDPEVSSAESSIPAIWFGLVLVIALFWM